MTSSAALHTARVIIKNFDLVVRPPESLPSGRIDVLKPDEKCVSVLVDYATNVFELTILRPELSYWQKRLKAGDAEACQIANFFQKVLSAFDKIPKDPANEDKIVTMLETPKEFMHKSVVHILSKPAREVSRFIFYYYFVTPKKKSANEILDRNEVAKLADVSLGLSRAMEILPYLKSTNERLKAGKATPDDIRKFMRELGVHFQYMPVFENREEEQKVLV